MDLDFFCSQWDFFKVVSDKRGEMIVHQPLGGLDTDLQKLLYWEKAKPEVLSEEGPVCPCANSPSEVPEAKPLVVF